MLGEVSVNKRELAAAIEPLQAARRLLAQPSPVPALANDWRKAQGAAAFWLGHVYFTQRLFPLAKAAWEDYRSSSLAWLDTAPGQLEPLVEVSYALTNLSILLLTTGNLSGAEAQFQNSIDMKQQALQLKPQDLILRKDLSNSQSWLASALEAQGKFALARAQFQAGLLEMRKVRAEAPHDLQWIYEEAVIQTHLGRLLLRQGQSARAAQELQMADYLLRDLLKQEPKNRLWRRQLAITQTAWLDATSPNDALPQLQAMLADVKNLDQGASATAAIKRLPWRAQASLQLSDRLQQQGRNMDARAILEQLLPVLRNAATAAPEDLQIHTASGQVRLALATLLNLAKARDEASAQCVTVLKDMEGLKPFLRLHYEITEAWVRAHSCLGRTQEVTTEHIWLAQHDPAQH